MHQKSSEPSEEDPRTTILVADDSEGVRRSLRRILRDYPYRIREAGSTSEASRILEAESGRIALAIVDIVFPEEGGVSLMRRIRDHDPAIPVIAITGGADLNGETDWLLRNVAAYLIKPFDNAALSRTLERLLR